jgi:uncharacterized protein (TIGR03083 family)
MTDYLAHLRADIDAVLGVLGVAELSEPVSSCPGWDVRELVEHLGSVHRWAADIVRTGAPSPLEDQHGIEDLRGWFAAGGEELIATLADADPEEPCWSFTSARTKGFWLRRQALETVVHRWDAQHAVGQPGSIDATLAADGVTEVVTLMTPRQITMERIPPLPATLQLNATDTSDEWVLGEGAPTARVEASAETLLLLLWHRVDPGDPRVRTSGDAAPVLRLALAP